MRSRVRRGVCTPRTYRLVLILPVSCVRLGAALSLVACLALAVEVLQALRRARHYPPGGLPPPLGWPLNQTAPLAPRPPRALPPRVPGAQARSALWHFQWGDLIRRVRAPRLRASVRAPAVCSARPLTPSAKGQRLLATEVSQGPGGRAGEARAPCRAEGTERWRSGVWRPLLQAPPAARARAARSCAAVIGAAGRAHVIAARRVACRRRRRVRVRAAPAPTLKEGRERLGACGGRWCAERPLPRLCAGQGVPL